MAKLSLDTAAKVADVEAEGTLTLRDPFTKEKLADENGANPVSITMIGAHTKTAQKIRRQIANRRIRKPGAFQDDPAGANEAESGEFLARLTRGWANLEDANGPIDFTRENAERVYRVEWIRLQVDAFAANPEHFGESPLGPTRGNSSRTPSTDSDSPAAPAAVA